MTLCQIGEKLSDKQLREISDEEEEIVCQELSQHLAKCDDAGCKEVFENRVRVGIQDRNGNYLYGVNN